MPPPVGDDDCTIGPPLSPAGGVAICGCDLSRPLSPALRRHIHRAFLEHQIVVFPGQRLSREAQFAFSAEFGEVEEPEAQRRDGKRRGVARVLSNLDAAGRPVDRSNLPVSNYRWHTDKPYYAAPPMMTTLYGVELPPTGGDTEFANTAQGYAALPKATRHRIEELRVVFRWGAVPGRAIAAAAEQAPAVDHPLVRTHPETGKKALYLGNHASHLQGLPPEEGAALLGALLEHTTRREFVYVHRWRPGDLVIWDNRCLVHRAVGNYDRNRDRRILHRTQLRGTIPF